ncbi:MAG: MFS transporter [Candidatus Rokubacteria bacterium]|nr:MFS transporter [Candidatus Rokubacteria bacterium]
MGLGRWRRLAREPRVGVLAASFVTLVLVQGATFTFPVFLVPLTREFGGLRGVAAAAFSLHNLVVGLTATVVDPLMGRFGERRVFAVGALVLGTGLALSGTAASAPGLILWFSLVAGAGAGLLGSVAQTVLLSRWFPAARGTVVGLALAGMGVGMFLFGPLSAVLIERVGWRATFLVLGAGVALLLLPTNAFAPGAPPESPAGPAAGARKGEVRVGDILRTARFWCFAAAFFFTPVSNFMVTTHQVAHIVEAGIDPRWAATAFGVMGLLSAVGRAGFGALSDRIGRIPAALGSYAATVLGILALLLVRPGSPHWLIYAFIALFGLTLGARGPIVAALAADLYRGRTYGTVLGLITLGNRLGSAIGPWLGGVIYDLTGSYRTAFAVSIAAIVVAALALAAAGRAGRPA